MEAYLYKITIGVKTTLVLSNNAADALESIESKAGTRSLELAGKAKFSVDEKGGIASYHLKSNTHQANYGREAVISHGVRASMSQEAALQQKPVVLSQHEETPSPRQSLRRGAKSKNHAKASAQSKKSPLNPKFFISTKSLGNR